MATFRPPTDNNVYPVIVANVINGYPTSREQRLANRLGKHLTGSDRGRNVYLLTNGLTTEKQPSDEESIVRTYWGGHNNEIDSTEEATLIAAGYGDYIT